MGSTVDQASLGKESSCSADRRQSNDATLVEAHHLFIRIIQVTGQTEAAVEEAHKTIEASA